MRVSLVGTGFIAAVHAKALKELGQELVVVVNQTHAKAETFAKDWAVARFGTDFSLALAADIDVVHICTPPTSHYQMIKAALLAGKHVVCEKPLCLNPAEAKEVMLLASEKQLIGAVLFNIRFHEACQQVKAFIASADFGTINLIHGTYLQAFHALPDAYSWRYISESAGPMRATTEIGSHWIDLARYWTGLEVAAVSANFGHFNPHRVLSEGMMYPEEREGGEKLIVDSEDAAVISLRFSNGAIGNVVLSEVSHGRSNRLHLEVTGSKQSVWWTNEVPYQWHSSEKNAGIRTQTNAFGGGFPETFKAFFESVYRDIEEGYPPIHDYPTFYDGYVNTTICAAIFESARHHSSWVSIT
ncbi:MAG: Gfo/Idh/MocA family oxidoreductase [Saprospiraceae bacterium]